VTFVTSLPVEYYLDKIIEAGYSLGSLSQSPRGWEVILWSGPIGYSSYAASTADSPAKALHSAMLHLQTTGGTELDSNAPKIKLDLHSFIKSITPPAEPIKRRI
jgi:hypothetical protein